MIRVYLKRDRGKVESLTVTGHACSAPKGEDLVCAAVSALVQTFYFSLERLLSVDVSAKVRDGYLALVLPADLPEDISAKIALLAESMLVGLDEINQSYPGLIELTEE